MFVKQSLQKKEIAWRKKKTLQTRNYLHCNTFLISLKKTVWHKNHRIQQAIFFYPCIESISTPFASSTFIPLEPWKEDTAKIKRHEFIPMQNTAPLIFSFHNNLINVINNEWQTREQVYLVHNFHITIAHNGGANNELIAQELAKLWQ